jgi:enoyl-CoA hydratase/3-hydroxyacyl-CoA dehydrogenase
MFVFKAGVVGAGTRGAGIAQLIAAAGIPVVLCDPWEGALEAGLAQVRALTATQQDALVAAGRRTRAQADAQLEATLALVEATTSHDALGNVDLVIEAVAELLELKLEVLAALDAATPGHAILASDTAGLSVSELAAATTRPERVLGLHFSQPLSVTRLVEIVEGIETTPETMAAATSFAASIRRTAIRCADVPGLVVGRVLTSAASELWRAQEEGALDIAALDGALAGVAPAGAFALADMLGLDRVLHLTEWLREIHGERFHVHAGMRELVARGELGAKTGRGFYEAGAPRTRGEAGFEAAALVERFTLKALVESCRLLEEEVASTRDIDVALSAGAGMAPAPFARADAEGLGDTLRRLEAAAGRWGEAFEPPVILRRLVAQGRLGAGAGQGFFPTPRADPGRGGPVKLESRGEVAIAWLDNPPANSISLDLLDALAARWRELSDDGGVRALVIASALPSLFCAGADIKAFVTMDVDGERELLERMGELLLEMGRSPIATVAAVNGLAYGGGCELAMGADVRIAAQSASFAQPEIKLGIMPGFGGTQRLPRLVGAGRALEMNLLGEPVDAFEAWEYGLVNRVVPDHELLDTALAWARRLAAAPAAALEQIKIVSAGPGFEAGLDAEKAAFDRVFATADAREGISAFLERRPARFGGP